MSSKKSRNRWNHERVISDIRGISDPSAKRVQRSNGSLYSAACRLFGSWAAAIEAAGLPYLEVRKRKPKEYWTKERLIDAIHSLPVKDSSYVRQVRSDIYNAANKLFGGWQEALEAFRGSATKKQ